MTIRLCLAVMAVILAVPHGVRGQASLVQVRQDFSEDPGWDGWQNRVVGEDNPTIVQDFGWSPTRHASERQGEIGGRIWVSTTPAWYGLPFGRPLSFKDRFSASGSIAIVPGRNNGAYFGFFNSKRQGWR